MAFLWRWLFAFVLLAATYNPTSLNFISWAIAGWDTQLPFVVLGGLILVVGYVVYLTATLRSIGLIGVVLVLAVIGALLWALYYLGWLTLSNAGLNIWIGILAMSLVLAIGMYWGILFRKLSGQVEVDDNDA